VRLGDLVAISTAPFEVGPVEPADVELVAERLATLTVALEGGAPAGRRFDVEARRIEGDAEVLGQGFCSRHVARPDLSLSLPLGRYRVRLLENGREGPAKELALDIPGVRAQVTCRGHADEAGPGVPGRLGAAGAASARRLARVAPAAPPPRHSRDGSLPGPQRTAAAGARGSARGVP
jgi:hypothetical protein